MRKEKVDAFLDFVLKHSKIVFPILVIVTVATTVSVGLNANRVKADQNGQEIVETPGPVETPGATEQPKILDVASVVEPTQEPLQTVSEDVPLVLNENEDIRALVLEFYNAWAQGDGEVLRGLYDELSESELLRYLETARYVDFYPTLDVYTKPGLTEGSTVVYVYYKVCFKKHEEEIPGYEVFYICSNEDGNLYIKNEDHFTEEEKEYITTVTLQDDVLEFHNRVTAEYNDLMEEHPQVLAYLHELGSQVEVAIGETLAQQTAAAQEPGTGEEPEEDPGAGEESAGEQTPEETGPWYAVSTTTVNVRSSDSEQADKLGKVPGGTRVQVQEVQINGWSRVVYEGGEGFIKSEYLAMEGPIEGLEVSGTVTALDNVRIRASASLESEKLGLLAEGESLEYYAFEDGWCKVNYEGKVAYVKAEFVKQN